jgi:hypothetical protein
MTLYDSKEGLIYSLYLIQGSFAATPGLPDALINHDWLILEICDTSTNRLGMTAQQSTDVADATVAQLERFDSGIAAAVLL